MKIIKKLILILIILIIVIVSMIMIIKYKNNMRNNQEIQKELEEADQGFIYENNDNGFKKLKDPSIFYTMINIVNNYLQVLSYDGSAGIDNNPYGIENENQQQEIVLDMLDKDYIEENNIGNDFKNKIKLIKIKYNLIPITIKVRYEDDIISYIVNVYLENIENNNLEEKYYIVRLDNQNGTFSIEPILEKYSNIDEISVKHSENKIEQNNYNKFNIETVSVEGLVKIYMQHFTSMSINHPDLIYDNYLDEEYRDKRFGSLEEFKKYIQANKDTIQQIRIKKYSSEDEGEQTKYVFMDMHENTYEFYELATMDYKVKLDTYTIPTDKFKETYEKAQDYKKVQMNIDKFFQMINRQDYKTAYNCLAQSYKNNYFATEDEFEKFAKNNFYTYNKVSYEKYEQKGNKLYIFSIKLGDITGENAEKKDVKIIMQLNENLDFEMSFGM